MEKETFFVKTNVLGMGRSYFSIDIYQNIHLSVYVVLMYSIHTVFIKSDCSEQPILRYWDDSQRSFRLSVIKIQIQIDLRRLVNKVKLILQIVVNLEQSLTRFQIVFYHHFTAWHNGKTANMWRVLNFKVALSASACVTVSVISMIDIDPILSFMFFVLVKQSSRICFQSSPVCV